MIAMYKPEGSITGFQQEPSFVPDVPVCLKMFCFSFVKVWEILQLRSSALCTCGDRSASLLFQNSSIYF